MDRYLEVNIIVVVRGMFEPMVCVVIGKGQIIPSSDYTEGCTMTYLKFAIRGCDIEKIFPLEGQFGRLRRKDDCKQLYIKRGSYVVPAFHSMQYTYYTRYNVELLPVEMKGGRSVDGPAQTKIYLLDQHSAELRNFVTPLDEPLNFALGVKVVKCETCSSLITIGISATPGSFFPVKAICKKCFNDKPLS